jgi:hypothetical protein
VADLTTPASVVYTKMYRVAPSSTELSKLVEFDNTQYTFGKSIGVQDAIVYVLSGARTGVGRILRHWFHGFQKHLGPWSDP